jgi:uncharacterized membrane protein YfcA
VELGALSIALLALAAAMGAAVQAATGFGFAVLAAPVYLAVLDSTAAVPILVALHVVQCAFLVPRVWGSVPWHTFLHLAVGAAVGCPLGLWLFSALDVRQLKLAAGILILVATGLLIRRRSRPIRPQNAADSSVAHPASATIVTGALAGALTAVLVMPGPPLMVHFLHRPLPQEPGRALSITFFAACYVAVFAAHIMSGTLTPNAWGLVPWLVLPVLAGTAAGIWGARWLSDRHFAAAIYVLLVAAGLGALLSALL